MDAPESRGRLGRFFEADFWNRVFAGCAWQLRTQQRQRSVPRFHWATGAPVCYTRSRRSHSESFDLMICDAPAVDEVIFVASVQGRNPGMGINTAVC